ncbi:MAG: DUF4012 domain-containing protein [Candidatus Levybacteria bacterium]|nr:DUF4012 domain-containing protein [Candidatus Levybacteria bacterium]
MNSSMLIVDREGLLGEAISKKLPSEAEVIFIDERKKVPKIPNNHYDCIFFIQSEKLEEKDLREEIIKKAENDRARFIYILGLSKKTKQYAEEVKSFYNKANVVVYGDLFGEEVVFKIDNAINRFLYQVKTKGILKVLGGGTLKTYPVFFEDAIANILKVVFLEHREKIFFLFPKTALTELSLAHLIQKIDPLLRIDFAKGEDFEKEALTFPTKGEYLLEEAYPLKKKIEGALSSLTTDSLSPPLPKKNSKTPLLFAFYYLLFILILPSLLTLSSAFGGAWALSNSKKMIEKADFSAARKYASISLTSFSFAQKSSAILLLQAGLVGKREAVLPIASTITSGGNIAQTMVYSLDGFESFKLVFTGKSHNPEEDFLEGLNKIKKIKTILQGTADVDVPSSLSLLTNIADVLPAIFGFESPKTYLVLFQNNMELRPGGGFIGSYGILKVDKGKVQSFNIYDVYDADGQLKGHVEPPFPIRRFLPSVHWYLRDSNFSPDFAKSASSSAFFFKEEVNEIADGVIGVDVAFVKGILKTIGPVDVPDYEEKVEFNNLYSLAQSYAQKDFFPGSTQKKDFLRSLFNAINEDVLEKKDISYLSLVEEIAQSVKQKHLLFAYADKNIQNVFTVNRLSSSLWDDREEGPPVVNDFLGISEANLGVNKANYFVKRKINQETTLGKEGTISGKLTLSYQNQASSSAGDYKNYLRIILPFGAKLSSILIDETEQALVKAVTDPLVYEKAGFVPPNGLEVEETEEQGKSIFGFLVAIPAQSSKTVEIVYVLPPKPLPDVFSYSLWVFKQPGTEDDPYSFSLSYPEGFKLLKGAPLRGAKNLAEDINFKIDLLSK